MAVGRERAVSRSSAICFLQPEKIIPRLGVTYWSGETRVRLEEQRKALNRELVDVQTEASEACWLDTCAGGRDPEESWYAIRLASDSAPDTCAHLLGIPRCSTVGSVGQQSCQRSLMGSVRPHSLKVTALRCAMRSTVNRNEGSWPCQLLQHPGWHRVKQQD